MVNARAQGRRRLYQALAAGPTPRKPHDMDDDVLASQEAIAGSRGEPAQRESLTRQGKYAQGVGGVAPAGVKGARRFVRRKPKPAMQATHGRP